MSEIGLSIALPAMFVIFVLLLRKHLSLISIGGIVALIFLCLGIYIKSVGVIIIAIAVVGSTAILEAFSGIGQ